MVVYGDLEITYQVELLFEVHEGRHSATLGDSGSVN